MVRYQAVLLHRGVRKNDHEVTNKNDSQVSKNPLGIFYMHNLARFPSLHARIRPTAEVIMHDGPWITYSDSLNRSLHLADWLRNRGMGVGTIVALGLTAHEWLEVVVLKPGMVMDLERLVVQCGEHMVSFDVSRDRIVTDALLRNPSCKVLKREIRGRLQ